MDLRGRWRKESEEPCAARYPAEIEFAEATYMATKGPEQRYIVWDAGIYRVAGEDRLVISIATDELVSYPFTLEGNRVSFIDQEGCEFSYRRLAG